ncbi:thiolase family protein [Pseudogracilibacillus auburnensis]|uniref:thiolase family protein n=1 Tax=Pseudogracilibacillus auburnensis TaxID=1494959 RepID=UPI001A95D02C|nr:thiolase family protein [Pseudogracilibacillus auburnensis]MBO1003182.1 thiolase family protein [Pseudogracilibacillus auburnensis]
MEKAVIIDAIRTPIGRYGGSLKDVRPDDLGALVVRSLIERNEFPLEEMEDIYFGAANQSGEDNRNVARMIGLLADLPESVGGVTVNRLCGSSLDAVNQAAKSIMCGEGDIFIAGGVESMTRAPFVTAKNTRAYDRKVETYDTTMGWRFVNEKLSEKHYPYSMIETADNVAEKYQVSREEQDQFALESQLRAKKAMELNKLKDEIVPVEVKNRTGTTIVDVDEHPRPDSSLEKISQLKSIYPKGTVTAANASGINDGASAVLVMSETRAKELGLTPMAYIESFAVAGVDPAIMGIGPVPATRKALKRANITTEDLDLIELNEAFAAQSLACIKELSLDTEKVNVNGGSIAYGHPLGASGARILTTLLHEMQRRNVEYGLATMCIGVGQGIATVVKKY